MPRVQFNSVNFPLLLTPRIDGVPVTQTQIKNDFSSSFVSDLLTPLDFYAEFTDRLGNVTTFPWSADQSSDTEIFFPINDSFYQTVKKYSLLVYWTVSDASSGIPPYPILERIYTSFPTSFAVTKEETRL